MTDRADTSELGAVTDATFDPLDRAVQGYRARPQLSEVGTVVQVASGIARACLNESLAGAGRVAIRTLQRPQQVQLVLAPLVGEAHPVMHSLPTRRARMRQNNLHTRGKLLNYR